MACVESFRIFILTKQKNKRKEKKTQKFLVFIIKQFSQTETLCHWTTEVKKGVCAETCFVTECAEK